MKNFSSSQVADEVVSIPVKSFTYRDICDSGATTPEESIQRSRVPDRAGDRPASAGISLEEVNELVARARAEVSAEVEERIRADYQAKAERETAKIKEALESFQAERKGYFARVETDVVHLALAIAAKILHREAQVDPLLVAALVRVAVDKLHDGSSVSVRVSPASAEKWRSCLATALNGSSITLIEDVHLEAEDCILETDLGSANFSIDAQLKEIEHGFFDLLAQRPATK
jgi:flagellar assembly protein FliH